MVVQPRYPTIRIWLVLALALFLRLLCWAQPLHAPANDEVEYLTVAHDLLAGRGWIFYTQYHWLRAPLYPLFLAASLWLTQNNLHLAALPNIILSVANVGLVALLTGVLVRDLGGSQPTRAPLVAALLAAFLVTFTTFASLWMSETLFSFCFTAGLLALSWAARLARMRYRLACTILAGLCFGLATLTRSALLPFLPIAALWLAWQVWRVAGWRSALLPPVLLALTVALVIAPWTLRNCRAYGRCILIETGFSYNLWAFNEPHEDQTTIFQTLAAIPNPAVRSDVATQHGLARLREDPAILLRKLWPNWIYLWRVKPVEDRFLFASYYADPAPVAFLAALIGDDLLYLVILLAATLGATRLLLRGSPVTLLCVGWIGVLVATTALTHAEGRYRHFLFTVLIPLAATLFVPWQRAIRLNSWAWFGSAVLAALFAATVLTFYPWEWAARGANRSWNQLLGELALLRNDLPSAQHAYEHALVIDSTPDGWLALGTVALQQGDTRRAERAYRAAWDTAPPYPQAIVLLGDLLRSLGHAEAARSAFIGRYADSQVVLDWAWSALHPVPPTHIAVGDGLDFGYIGGAYPAETLQGAEARWTNGRGLLRLALNPTGPQPLRLRLAAPRPTGEPVTVDVCAQARCQAVPLQPTWRTIHLLLPPLPANTTLELRSPTFVAADGRRLGVLVDWVARGGGR